MSVSPISHGDATVDAELINAFRNTSTALISDNLSRTPGAVGIRPFNKNSVMVGTALTVRVRSGDNLSIHQALEMVRGGEVIVVDGGGDVSRALVGEIMLLLAQTRGAAGIVVDGAIRDTKIITQSDFPCFARAAIHRGPYKYGPGEINVPVSIGGLVVEPGDIVVGDEDGVVAFSPSIARELLAAVHEQDAREEEIIRSIRDGSYAGAYGATTRDDE